MKNLLLTFLFLAFSQSVFAYKWSNFGGKAKTITVYKKTNLFTRKISKFVRIKVKGTVASCGGLGPFLVKSRAHVVACNPYLLELKLEYWRTERCDQAMEETESFTVKLPEGCDVDLKRTEIGLSNRYSPTGVRIIYTPK